MEHEDIPEVKCSTFFDAHKHELKTLLGVLEMSDLWSDNLSQLVTATQPWVAGDHFKPEHKTILKGDQADSAKKLYDGMGLVQEKPLPPEKHDQVIVLGGTQRANNERLQFLADQIDRNIGIGEGGIVLWGGERPIFTDVESAPLASNRAALSDPAHSASANLWLKALKAHDASPSNETELLRIAALHYLGELTLRRAQIHLGVARPLISRYEFKGLNHNVTLLNTAAVSRPHGEPRHTTEACAKTWLRTMPPAIGAKIAFVTGNPYIHRTSRVVERVLEAHNRSDVQLTSCGPAAYDNARDYLFLGEIARNLYEDQQGLIK